MPVSSHNNSNLWKIFVLTTAKKDQKLKCQCLINPYS